MSERTENPVVVTVSDVGGVEVVTLEDNNGPRYLNPKSISDHVTLAVAIQEGAYVMNRRK